MNQQPCNTARTGIQRALTVMLLTVVTGMMPRSARPGSIPYLPSIGPVPLRFELAAAPGLAWTWKQLRVAECPPGAARSAESPAAATNSVAGPTLSPVVTNSVHGSSVAVAGPVETPNSGPQPDSGMQPERSDDVTIPVSPEVLVEFFKPVAGGKAAHGATGTKPGQIGFTPPAPKGGPESQAIYKTQ